MKRQAMTVGILAAALLAFSCVAISLRAPHIPWQPHRVRTSSALRPLVTVAGGMQCTFTGARRDPSTDARMHCEREGAWLWGRSFAWHEGDDGDLLLTPSVLVAVVYAGMGASGTLTAFQPETGDVLWSQRMIAARNTMHSEYYNTIQLQLIDGMVVVFGDESDGKYTEAFDIEDGKRRYHQMFDEEGQPLSVLTVGDRFLRDEVGEPYDRLRRALR